MSHKPPAVRPIALVAFLLLTPAMAGCIDLQSGELGLCVGGETVANILRDDRCTEWVIEVDWVSGQAPSDAALSLLEARMEELASKDSIRIIKDQSSLRGQSEWTINDLNQLEQDTRDHRSGGTTVTTHVLYVDGELADRETVLGVTFSSSQLRYVVMFKENIRESTSDPLVTTTLEEAESAVLIHEFGHVIGLVNNGLPMVTDHEADTCGSGANEKPDSGHSDNPDSVMTCQLDTTALFGLFGGDPPTEFDANDKHDVCEFGGRC